MFWLDLWPNAYVFGILELGDRDLGICTVTILVAGQVPGDAGEIRGFIKAAAKGLAANMQGAIIIDTDRLDASEDHVGGIKGVSVED